MGAMQSEASPLNARIIEIFSSIQGEGLWVGRPQTFIRFHGCRLKCQFCDTPLTHLNIHSARIEYPPYSKIFEKHSLEFNFEELNQIIERFGVSSLTLTGGEPLEQVDFIEPWLRELNGRYEILLETSGVEVEALQKVISFIDMVSLDIKLPSATHERPFWEVHEQFIQVALTKPCYAKIVFDETMTNEESERVGDLIRRYPFLPFIFQPVSPVQKRDLAKIFKIFQRFSTQFPKQQIRLIPQVHKFLGIS